MICDEDGDVRITGRGRLDQVTRKKKKGWIKNPSMPLQLRRFILKATILLIPRLPSSKQLPSWQLAAAAPLAPRYRTRQSSCPEIAATVGMRGRELPSAPSSSTRSLRELRFRGQCQVYNLLRAEQVAIWCGLSCSPQIYVSSHSDLILVSRSIARAPLGLLCDQWILI